MKLKKSDLEDLLRSEDPYDYEKFWNDRHLNAAYAPGSGNWTVCWAEGSCRVP